MDRESTGADPAGPQSTATAGGTAAEHSAEEPSSEARAAVDAFCLDQRRRWLAGDRRPAEAYFAQRPELARRPDELIELVYNEFLIREELFDRPDSQEFFRRFPACADALRRQLELHAGLQNDDPWDAAEPTEELDAPPSTGGSTSGSSSFFPPFPLAAGAANRPDGAAPIAEEGGRFEQLRRIGAGGMGVVYAAYDRRWRQAVALKTLHRQDPAALLRLKQEFRVLADHSHPNLVQLFELFVDQGRAYFTMEFVEGCDLVAWCRSQGEGGAFPEGAVRQALRQLVEGLQAVHAADKLHCDLKPSNVLVSTAGRVVLLDFGMAHDLRRADPARIAAQQTGAAQQAGAAQPSGAESAAAADYLRGTLAYLAPERFRGGPPSRAADWYAVGVMLYQALVGRTPFVGDAAEMVRAKLRGEAVRPRELGSTASPELERLCLDWLSLDPAARPSAEEALARLSRADEPHQAFPRREDSEPLVGRGAALQLLHAAFREAAAGRNRRLLVHGASGMGKTTLVQRFAAELESTGRGRVLTGRCREYESIPFKAVDALLDHLAQLLKRLPADELEALLPPNTGALAELFPALLRSPAVASVRRLQPPPLDPVLRRTAAFEALGGLLAALSRKTPLVVWIDDVQWGDGDSARLLVYALRAAEGAAVLWLACGRSEHLAESPFLCELRAALGPDGFEEQPLPPLAPSDAAALAQRLLTAQATSSEPDRSDARHAALIARQSSGNPFLILELARAAPAGSAAEAPLESGEPPAEDARIDRVLWSRIDQTTTAARRLLEVVSTAGGPLRLAVACRAAHLDDDPQKALMELRACRLIRTWRRGEADLAEPYHDRIREGVVRRLPDDAKRARHRGLAEAFEAEASESQEPPDPRPLALHYHAAQEPAKAALYAEAAGGAAFHAAAFDEAARFYRLATEHPSEDLDRRRALLRRLGDALAGAGRGGEAGPLYESLAAAAPPRDAAELRTLAVEQLLRSGRFNEGIDAFRALVESLGLTWPRNYFGVAWRYIGMRLALAARGLGFRLRPAAEVDPTSLQRIDACWTTGLLISNTDFARCFYFMTLHCWYALRAGEAGRIARALGTEAMIASAPFSADSARSEQLVCKATELAERSGDPLIVCTVMILRCGLRFYQGNWRACEADARAAIDYLRSRCVGAHFEMAWCYDYRLHSLFSLGRWKEHRREVLACIEDARERGDVYLAAEVRSGSSNMIWLAADDVDEAERALAVAVASRPRRDYLENGQLDRIADVHIKLYRGDGAAAWSGMESLWKSFSSTNQAPMQVMHIELAHIRVRAGLAALAAGVPPPGPRKSVAEALRSLGRSTFSWAASAAALHRASLASLEGRRDEALQLLHDAEAGLERHGLAMCAAAALRRRGELLGGAVGERLAAAADARFAAEEVRRPDRIAHLLAPGFFLDSGR